MVFKQWTLLGSIILKKEEWKKVMSYSNYDGDYAFTNSEKLNLQKDKLNVKFYFDLGKFLKKKCLSIILKKR